MDRQLVEKAIQDYEDMLLSEAYSYTKNTCDAEDIVQETFLALMAEKKEFASQEHLRAWLLRVAANKSKNHLKSGWIAKRRVMPENTELQSQEHKEKSEVAEAVDALEEKYRIPIQMFYYEGYSIKEIAEALGKKSTTVGSLLSRGRKKLKKHIFFIGAAVLLPLAVIVGVCVFHARNAGDTASEEENAAKTAESKENVERSEDSAVYRYYGDDVIYAKQGCTLRLENIQTLVSEDVKGIYLYDCESGTTTELAVVSNAAECRIEQSGAYCIYALTKSGELVDLSSHVSIETESGRDIVEEITQQE